MQLDRIRVAGFKSIRSLDLPLTPLNILIGANGAGKSNFVSLFRALNEMVEGNFQVYVAKAGGADALLYYGQKTTSRIRVGLVFGANAYRCAWEPTVADELIFSEEVASFHAGRHPEPCNEPLGAGHKESMLPAEARRRPGKVADHVLRSMRSWKVYHFHDTSDSAAVKKIGGLNDNAYLRSDAGNLAAFLYRLQRTALPRYEAIRNVVRQVAPFFDDFILRPLPENRNRIQLEWRERGSDYPFLSHQLSDGTLRFICIATLLLQPDLPSTILIDEPELGLHPYAIGVLASLLRSTATRSQVIVSTQSVPLVSQFDPQDLLVVDREEQATTIKRIDPHGLAEWLEEYTLGELWEKNVLGGRPA
jgi:predicted ATPase